ncbi:hypothetical protein T492DRAFT_227345 [Pavlovales sp. CCMP2436]|nr:hypothetical protein T492DRAFT_227345 [Pavlovales sp. CCMP2436]
MLYAFKNELHAQLARDLISVRTRELDYYTTNIRNIGFSAALLTGFAFGTLASHRSQEMIVWIELYSTEYTHTSTLPPFVLVIDSLCARGSMSTPPLPKLARPTYAPPPLAQPLHPLTWPHAEAMGLTIYTLYICLLLSITGPGLALRGPEGSVDRAVFSLARGCRRVIQAFAFSLYLFIVSMFFQAFLTFHVYVAVICAVFLVYYMYVIRRHSKGVMGMFSIDPNRVVTGRFEVEKAANFGLGNHDLFPTVLDLLTDVFHWASSRVLKLFGLRKKKGPDVNAAVLHKPSEIARDMVELHQSPFLELAAQVTYSWSTVVLLFDMYCVSRHFWS